METYIAIDIGASSGRLMLGQMKGAQLTLEEVHRFKNGFRRKNGCMRWDIGYLIKEILLGLQKVKESGADQCYVGIDTWGVDYCLLDQDRSLLADPVSYRDQRTSQAVEVFQQKMSLEKLYEKTGIQIQPFNTLFQLMTEDDDLLAKADKLLLMPDYLGFVFTGEMAAEKTNASTMQMLNAKTGSWDKDLLALLGIKETLFPPLAEAGTILGKLQKERFQDYDLPDATFITVASHDTASAVIGTPGQGDDWAYLSSGTWSLLGVETEKISTAPEAYLNNYTNEWGAKGTIRFLKNIMGMWLIQEVSRVQNYRNSYSELAELAETAPAFQHFIDVNDASFLAPDNMITAIQDYCRKSKQSIPETPATLARTIYDSLALCYALELKELEKLKRKQITKLHIVGGGSSNTFLNQLTADVANIKVIAGPSEATAIGNIAMQMVTAGEVSAIEKARACIRQSFDCTIYKPRPISPEITAKYEAFLKERNK